jgi:transposase
MCMSRRRFDLTDKEAQQLPEAAESCTFAPERKRYEAVPMYDLGQSYGEVKSVLECSRTAMCSWCLKYQRDGIEGLEDKRRSHNWKRIVNASSQD